MRPRLARFGPRGLALAVACADAGVEVVDPAGLDAPTGDGAGIGPLVAVHRASKAPLAVVGAGVGAPAALVAAALVGGIVALILVDPVWGPLVVGPTRPSHLLDLVPGLRCPLQVHTTANDGFAEALVERVRARGGAAQLLLYPGLAADDPAAVVRAARFVVMASA